MLFYTHGHRTAGVQVNASGAALHKAQESLSAVQDGWRGQQGCLGLGVGGAGEAGSGGALNGAAVGGTPGTGAGILGAGLAGAGLLPSSSASSSERDGLLGLLGMSAGNGNGRICFAVITFVTHVYPSILLEEIISCCYSSCCV